MPLWTILVIIPVVFVINWLLTALALSIARRIWHLSDRTFQKSLVLAAVFVVVSTAAMVFDSLTTACIGAELVCLIPLLLALLTPFLLVRFGLSVSWLKTVGVALSWLFLQIVLTVPIALLIRWQLLEPFHVPTGANAPAIIGNHFKIDCGNCDHVMRISATPMVFQRGAEYPPNSLNCTMCLDTIQIQAAPHIQTGEGIWVDKIAAPRRWDFIAYSSPEFPKTRFVHRLVGLPGETVQIAQGDVFVNGRRLVKDPGTAQDMWIPLYDSANRINSSLGRTPRWMSIDDDSAWNSSESGWMFSSMDDRPHELRFSAPLTDHVDYNQIPDGSSAYFDAENVRDLRLDVRLQALTGDGFVILRCSDGHESVEAEIHSNGDFELRADEVSHKGHIDLQDAQENTLSLMIRDGNAHLVVNKQKLGTIQLAPNDIESALETASTFRTEVSLAAQNCSLTVNRLTLFRDVHYQSARARGRSLPRATLDNPFTLGQLEYFVLGDNSAASSDSRYWVNAAPQVNAQPGAVPQDFIVGVVRLIYAPLDRMRIFR